MPRILVALLAGTGVVIACGGDGGDELTGPATGTLQVTTTTTGSPADPDGYRLSVDGGEVHAIATNGTLTLEAIAPGDRSVLLSELSAECTVVGENPRTVTVAAGSPVQVSFMISCPGSAAGQLAFTTDRDGNDEIYLVNADGTGLQRLTNDPAADRQPTWAPDGSKLAFASDRSGNFEIFVMNADGTNIINLTRSPASDFLPAWSPDGSKIAFVRDQGNVLTGWEIFVMDADGGNQVNLTNSPDLAAAPEWSPDGTRIAFQSDRDFDIDHTEFAFEIFLMQADGTQVVHLTNNPAEDEFPSWSPDGGRIAFQTDRVGNLDIFLADPSGENLLNLTSHAAQDFTAAWSPEGDRIAFSSTRYGGNNRADLLVVAPDGTGLSRLTAGDGSARFAAWRP